MAVIVGASLFGCSSSRHPAPVAPAPAPAPASKPAPADSNGISGDTRIDAILERSCYSCHSNGGSAPWRATVSHSYLSAGRGRDQLNFSVWPTYDVRKRRTALKAIEKSITSATMPPGDYTALDHSARLSADDKQALLEWVSQTQKSIH